MSTRTSREDPLSAVADSTANAEHGKRVSSTSVPGGSESVLGENEEQAAKPGEEGLTKAQIATLMVTLCIGTFLAAIDQVGQLPGHEVKEYLWMVHQAKANSGRQSFQRLFLRLLNPSARLRLTMRGSDLPICSRQQVSYISNLSLIPHTPAASVLIMVSCASTMGETERHLGSQTDASAGKCRVCDWITHRRSGRQHPYAHSWACSSGYRRRWDAVSRVYDYW